MHSERRRVPRFRLNPNHDVAALAEEYQSQGRIRIQRLLADDGLAELYDYLNEHDGWWQLFNTPNGIVELDRATRATMSAEEREAFDRQVNENALAGFQYRYEGLRVPEPDEADQNPQDLVEEFAELMSSEPMLDFLRAVTGSGEVAFTDGFVTAYGPGDFLTGHDDDVAGKERIAAYVFGMTPRWRLEWGGLLLFHGANEASVSGHVPRFNTLDLFSVPQRHSVTMVTPAAPTRRYAITGWLRRAA
jgi:Rps23 Pro-64 3,4-dihydroxylase Tpa1-like proline 4-hydroxylase